MKIMAPMLDISNEKDYQKMIKIADAIGIDYKVPNLENKSNVWIIKLL